MLDSSSSGPNPSASRWPVAGTWWVLAILLLVMSLAVLTVVVVEYRSTLARERAVLQAQARVVDDNLAQHVKGISSSLTTIRDNAGVLLASGRAGELSERLVAMSEVMPSVRTMIVVNAEGIVVASSRPGLLGTDVSQRSYFRAVKERPRAATLYVSEPFVTMLDVFSINLIRAMVGPDGRFAGIVSATLDPEYFDVLLRSVLYAPGTRSALVHGGGRVFVARPDGTELAPAQVVAVASVQPASQAPGAVEAVHTVPAGRQGEVHMLASRDGLSAALQLDYPLVTVVGRPMSEILAPWRRMAAVLTLLVGTIVLVALWTMVVLQRKQRDLDKLRRAREHSQREEAHRVQMALEGGDLGLWEVDLVSDRRTVDARAQRMVGLPPESPSETMAQWAQRIHPDDRASWMSGRDDYLAGKTEAFVADYRVRHENGGWTWLHSRAKVTARDAQGRALQLMGTYLDITERKEAEARIARSEQLLARMSRVSRTGGWDHDLRTGRSTWSDQMFQIRELDPLVDPDQDMVMNAYEPESRARLQAARKAAIEQQLPWDLELQMVTAKANPIWVRSQGEAVVENGVTVALTGTLQNVTVHKQAQMELKAANDKLEQLAMSDGLTGIANRRLFDQTLQTEWTRNARTQSPLGLLMIDIDHFKRYNDHYGHAGGDECLRRVAQLLAGCSRRAGDLVSRYGGEEFAILLPSTDLASASVVAQACLEAVHAARIDHAASPTSPFVTLSIGVASLRAQSGGSPLLLVEQADAALYRAKHRGRDQYAVEDPATVVDPVSG